MKLTREHLFQRLSAYKEIFLYGIFGVLTTAINILTYEFLTHRLTINFLLSNALAWILAFVFAYYTNSKFVFGCRPFWEKDSLKRFLNFLNSRVFTGILDMLLMWLLVDLMRINDSVSKIGVNIVVIALNYLMSKFWVFKGEKL